MALKWKSKILLAKLETTYNIDAEPTGAANGVLATEVALTPMEGSDLSRNLETPYLGAQGSVPIDVHAKLTFNVELAGSGTAGTAPAWGPLLRGCAVAETIVAATSVTYNPVSDDHESLSIYLLIEGTQFVLTGTRGNCTIDYTSSNLPYLKFEFWGLFNQPSEETRPTVALGGYKKPLAVSKANTPTFTLNAVSMVMRSFMLNLGNAVEPRFLVGSEDILITDKEESIEIKVEAVPLTTLNPFTLAAAQTDVATNLVHGLTAGNIATLTVDKAQMQRPQGLENAQNIMEWPLRLVPIPTSGNDQWSLTLT
jgi:hypothetical protein